MTDITTLLKDADPVRHEEGLSFDDAQAMRREMLGAIADSVMTVPLWRRPLTFAAAAALMFGVSGVMGHRQSSSIADSSGRLVGPIDAGSSADQRQLQFATPGGTRIIWIFDRNLRLQESMP